MEKFLKKNIYTLYMCVCVCVCIYICGCLVAQSCLTLCDPLDYSPPGSSVQRIFQARILEWVAISSSMDHPDQTTEPMFPVSPALQEILYPLSHQGRPIYMYV